MLCDPASVINRRSYFVQYLSGLFQKIFPSIGQLKAPGLADKKLYTYFFLKLLHCPG